MARLGFSRKVYAPNLPELALYRTPTTSDPNAASITAESFQTNSDGKTPVTRSQVGDSTYFANEIPS